MPKPRKAKDAITLLKEDHKKVKGLLSQLEKTTERGADRRRKLLGQIENEVKVHTTIEEEIFYPAYRDAVKKKDDRELYQEALEEHHVVDLVLAELPQVDPSADTFEAKMTVLRELIEHHVEEEQEEVFPMAEKRLGKERIAELGERLEERNDALESEAA